MKWTFETSNSVDSSPAIGPDGTIYVGSDDHNLYAINPNGTLKWSYRTGGLVTSSPAIGSNGTIYVGSEDHNLYAINPNGTLKWKFSTSGRPVRQAIAIGPDGTIYFGSTYDQNAGSGSFYALKPDGTLKWSYTDSAISDTFGSPAIDSNNIIYEVGWAVKASPETNFVYAFDAYGHKKWSSQQTGSSIKSVVVGPSGTIYFATGLLYNTDSDLVYALNPSNGATKWTYKTRGYMIDGLIVLQNEVICAEDSKKYLYFLNSNGTLKCETNIGDLPTTSPVAASDGTVYVGTFYGYLIAVYSGSSSGLARSPWPKIKHDMKGTGKYTNDHGSNPW